MVGNMEVWIVCQLVQTIKRQSLYNVIKIRMFKISTALCRLSTNDREGNLHTKLNLPKYKSPKYYLIHIKKGSNL